MDGKWWNMSTWSMQALWAKPTMFSRDDLRTSSPANINTFYSTSAEALRTCQVARLGGTANYGSIDCCAAQSVTASFRQEGSSCWHVQSIGGAGEKTHVGKLILRLDVARLVGLQVSISMLTTSYNHHWASNMASIHYTSLYIYLYTSFYISIYLYTYI